VGRDDDDDDDDHDVGALVVDDDVDAEIAVVTVVIMLLTVVGVVAMAGVTVRTPEWLIVDLVQLLGEFLTHDIWLNFPYLRSGMKGGRGPGSGCLG
jgi:hypothetical protein